MIPKVETFENNIAQEIKRKEASLTEISAASNNVGNDPVDLPKKPPVFFVALIVFFILCLFGFGMVIYFSITNEGKPIPINTPPITQTQATSSLQTLSPTLSNQIGRFVSKVEKKQGGYVLTINDYSSVFAYMTRNESDYIEELSLIFEGVPMMIATTTQPNTIVEPQSISTSTASTTPVVKTTTSSSTIPSKSTPSKTLASSSKIVSSSTVQDVPSPETIPFESIVTQDTTVGSFTDVTISNQNMRVWTRGKSTLVYSFVSNNIVLISNSKEGILALKNGLLR
jgi:hypothetical protein